MGVTKQQAESRPKQSRASTTPPYGETEVNYSSEPLAWTLVDSLMLVETIDSVNRAGDGISFARGARGRWLSVTILCGDGNSTLRAFTLDEADEMLRKVQTVARDRAK